MGGIALVLLSYMHTYTCASYALARTSSIEEERERMREKRERYDNHRVSFEWWQGSPLPFSPRHLLLPALSSLTQWKKEEEASEEE